MPTTLIEIARALEGTVNNGWINIRAPGHRASDRSLGFRFDDTAPDGIYISSFAHDDPDVCRAHIVGLLRKLAGGACATVEADVGTPVEPQTRRGAYALALFHEAEPIEGTPAEKYLRCRDIELAPAILATKALRFHPQTPFGKGVRTPALLALITHIVTGEPTGIQRIALADDGRGKRLMADGGSAKRLLGSARSSAVVFEPMGKAIAIAEGLETALSARQIFGVPVIAALSAGGVAHFPLIHGVKQLTIFADNDAPGLKAAHYCRQRYAYGGMHVKICYPNVGATDWNDHLAAKVI